MDYYGPQHIRRYIPLRKDSSAESYACLFISLQARIYSDQIANNVRMCEAGLYSLLIYTSEEKYIEFAN